MKDIAGALRSKLQFLRGRRGPNNDPFLFVEVTTLMYEAANKIERLEEENAKMKPVVEAVAYWGRAPVPYIHVMQARDLVGGR